MDYKTLVIKTSERSGLTKANVALVFNALKTVVVDTLEEGESVKFTGLGTFKMIKSKETRRKDPLTGVVREIPKRTRPAFVYSQLAKGTLKREV